MPISSCSGVGHAADAAAAIGFPVQVAELYHRGRRLHLPTPQDCWCQSAAQLLLLGCLQVTDLYQNCLKLASENKINKNNTWSLGLIDHLSDLVRPADSEGRSTNFQVGPTLSAVMPASLEGVHWDQLCTFGHHAMA